MFVTGAACGPLAANCYLVAVDEGQECVIIDPGMGAAPVVSSLVNKHKLTPVAVLATHGHFDHVTDAGTVANQYGIPLWIHSGDRHLLANPQAGLGEDFAGWLDVMLPDGVSTPARVETVDGHQTLDLAGLTITVIPAPGHTRGSVLYEIDDDGTPVVFTGDVVFAGSVGRTDMPGGDSGTMSSTLRGPVLSLPDAAHILPGHGPASVIAHERASNPYLRAPFLN